MKTLKLVLLLAGSALILRGVKKPGIGVDSEMRVYAGGAPSSSGGKSGYVTLSTDTVIGAKAQVSSPESFALNFMGA